VIGTRRVHHFSPKQDTNPRVSLRPAKLTLDEYNALAKIIMQLQETMASDVDAIVQIFSPVIKAICNKLRARVLNEIVRAVKNHPPIHSQKCPRMYEIYTEQPFLYAHPFPQQSSLIKPVSFETPPVPIKPNFTL
jgi:hypothetical protein